MSYENPTLAALEALLKKRDQLFGKLELLQARAERTNEKIRSVRRSLVDLENELHSVRISHHPIAQPTIAAPSRRNLDVYRAWAAVVEKISFSDDPRGLTRSQVAQTIQSSIPGVTAATVRSHLHRFKKRALLVQNGNYWQLGPNGGARLNRRSESGGP